MGGELSKEETDKWLNTIMPIKGELAAFMFGVTVAAFFHESKFGLSWERKNLMIPIQKHLTHPLLSLIMWLCGQCCSGDFLVPYFAVLYWALDQEKCIHGIWLVPMSEILNGCLKWFFRVPRPGWVDEKITMRAWSEEYSFPSSHAQIIWSLATFFTYTSVGQLRNRLYGSWGATALAYWYFLLAPFVLAAIVSFSRLYEGLHYPRDLTVGAPFGVSLAAFYARLLPFALQLSETYSPTMQIFLCLMVTAFWASLLWYSASFLGADPDTQRWLKTAANTLNAGKKLNPHSVPLDSYFGMCGVLFGLAVSVPLRGYFPLPPPTAVAQAVVRVILGFVLLFAVYFGLRAVEKKGCQGRRESGRIVRFFRYASVPCMITCVVPYTFMALGL